MCDGMASRKISIRGRAGSRGQRRQGFDPMGGRLAQHRRSPVVECVVAAITVQAMATVQAMSSRSFAQAAHGAAVRRRAVRGWHMSSRRALVGEFRCRAGQKTFTSVAAWRGQCRVVRRDTGMAWERTGKIVGARHGMCEASGATTGMNAETIIHGR